MISTVTSGCQCGRVRYGVAIDDDEAYLCHCRMYQRATGEVAAALKQVMRAAVGWTTREPDRYRSSPIVQRGFCAACATPLLQEGEGSAAMDLTIGRFDDPARHPVRRMGVESRPAAWLETRALPVVGTAGNGGIAAKWMEACGKLPD